MKTLLIFFVSLISFSTLLSTEEIVSKNEQVRQLLDDLSSANDPGIQYVIVDKNAVVFAHRAGLADIENKIPLSLEHTMAAFSMTKTLTAIAILQLVERGKIKLNSQVSQYVKHPYHSEITLRQLLSHTSGIPNPNPLTWIHFAGDHDDFDENAALSQVLADNPEPDASPGEEYGYSNIGYWLLGEIVETVSGQDYDEYVTKNIFEPLGLTRNEIGFQVSNRKQHAKGYLKKYSFMNLLKYFVLDEDVWGEYEGNWLHINNTILDGPAFGGAIGSAKAFSRILQDLLSEKSVLLEGKVKRYLFSQQKTHSGKSIDMTLGWHIEHTNGVRYYYKEGGGAGFRSEMRLYPDRGLASVMMVNRTSLNTRKQLNQLDSEFIK